MKREDCGDCQAMDLRVDEHRHRLIVIEFASFHGTQHIGDFSLHKFFRLLFGETNEILLEIETNGKRREFFSTYFHSIIYLWMDAIVDETFFVAISLSIFCNRLSVITYKLRVMKSSIDRLA